MTLSARLPLLVSAGFSFAMTPAPGIAQPPASAVQGRAGETVVPTVKIVPDCRDAAAPEEIVVCGTRSERSPYRLPPTFDGFDPNGPVDSVSRERHRLFEIGMSGIGSCSASGAGGMTGCSFIAWKDHYEQKAGIERDEGGFFIEMGSFWRRD